MNKFGEGSLSRESQKSTIENLTGEEKARIIVENCRNITPERIQAFKEGEELREKTLSPFNQDGLRGQMINLNFRVIKDIRDNVANLENRIERSI